MLPGGMTDQSAQIAKPSRVSSHDAIANELIAALRQNLAATAKGIAELGNRAYEARVETGDAEHTANEALSAAEVAETELMRWRALLEDYGRGIVDREELLRKTVGYV
jgi:hypothetical protein